MERIYNFEGLTLTPPDPMTGSRVKLRNGHLWLAADLAHQVFGDAQQAYAVYYDNLKAVLMAPEGDEAFRSAHEVAMLFIKTKNSQGDKSISIQEFMADYDIRDDDRDLAYLSAPGLPMIHISLD
jgi:hypothetical protein